MYKVLVTTTKSAGGFKVTDATTVNLMTVHTLELEFSTMDGAQRAIKQIEKWNNLNESYTQHALPLW
jgi:hypothetical protein